MNEEDLARKQGDFRLDIDKIKNLTISTITITPVKTTEEGRVTGDSSKNGYGETAVFECAVSVTCKTGKQMTMSTKMNENETDTYDIVLSDKVTPYKYIAFASQYRSKNSNWHGVNHRGDFSAEDGSVKIPYVRSGEFNEYYANLSAELSLLVYENAVIEGTNKASYTVTNYPVEYKDNPIAKAATAFDGVYTNGNKKLIVSTKGTDAEYFGGDIHVITDFDNNLFNCRSSQFDGDKKITNTTENGDGPVLTIELILDGDTIHYTSISHQQNNFTEKLDFKRTKEDALKTYEKYYKLMDSK
jgi:hypothetical protein